MLYDDTSIDVKYLVGLSVVYQTIFTQGVRLQNFEEAYRYWIQDLKITMLLSESAHTYVGQRIAYEIVTRASKAHALYFVGIEASKVITSGTRQWS
jgi:hypothetical protein